MTIQQDKYMLSECFRFPEQPLASVPRQYSKVMRGFKHKLMVA